MADFVKANIVAYSGGKQTTDGWLNVGCYSGTNRVVRLPFTVGESGANEFKFSIAPVYRNYGNSVSGINTTKFAFAITRAGDESYKNHNGTGDGFVTFTTNDAGNYMYTISGSVKKLLLPGDYYLWLFPNHTGSNVNVLLNHINTYKPTYELLGAAGLVRIDVGTGYVNAIPFIDNGSEWKQSIPNNDNGNRWDICG